MLALLAALAVATPLSPTAPLPEAYAITVSGGVTLGSHEAGYLYVMSEALKRSGRAVVPMTTGASAGSANGLATALASCSPTVDDPASTYLYDLWVPRGIDEGIRPEEATRTSLFTQAPLLDGLAAFDRLWAEGLPESCDVAVAIPVTRLEALPVRLNPDLALPRQTFRFAFRIQGRGAGVTPRIDNLVDPGAVVPQLLLPLTGEASDLDLVRTVISASAAFPIAFPPVQIDYCTAEMDADDPTACPAATDTALFVDGGVFDNIPLRTAHRMTQASLVQADGRPTWTTDDNDPRPAWPGVRHIYIDPVIRGYPERPQGLVDVEDIGLSAYLATFTTGFIEHARSAELYTLAEERPDVMASTFVTYSRFPQASGFVSDFVGAFDESFREWDFTLGMVDAWLDLERMEGRAPLAGRRALAPLLDTEAWAPMACLASWTDPSMTEYRDRCDGDDKLKLRILTQVALDRVYSECRGQDPETVDAWNHDACSRAARGELPPELVPNDFDEPSEHLREEGEGEFSHFLRLLAAYDFALDDLGVSADRARFAPSAMADALVPAIDAMAKQQPDIASQRLLEVVGRQGLGLAFAPPSDPAHLYALTGTQFELGSSIRLNEDAPWLRLNAALQMDGVLSLLIPDRESFNAGIAAGLSFDLRARQPGPARPIVGLRAAAQLGVLDDAAANPCRIDEGDARDCSQPEFQVFGAVELAELMRLQAEVDVMPWMPGDAIPVDVHLLIGLRF